jgi:hypothetical protein
MSYSTDKAEQGLNGSDSENSYRVDQVEIDWLFSFGNVSAQVDLQYEDNAIQPLGAGNVVEQAFVNYELSSGDVITAGRYATMLGFEALEPTGMYQFSTAYSVQGLNLTLANSYNQGVKYTRTAGDTFFGISLQDSAFGPDFGGQLANRLGGDDGGNYAIEVAGSTGLGNGFTLFAGGAFENNDAGDNQLLNAYVTYETGAWLFAAETKLEENQIGGLGADIDITSYMVMANYAYSDVASVTGRFTDITADVGNVEVIDGTKLTLAHNYAFSDNLALCAEVSLVDADNNGGADGEVTSAAVELLFTF